MKSWRCGAKTLVTTDTYTLAIKTRDGVEETSPRVLRERFSLKELTSLLRRVPAGSAEERKIQRALKE